MSSNRNGSKWLSAVSVALATTAGFAQAETRCDVSTARQSLAAETLCECDVVTTGMLRFIRRSEGFLKVLAETSEMCPGFASVLTDVPTATLPAGDTPDDSSDPGPRGAPGEGSDDTGGGDPGGDDTGGGDTGGKGGGSKGNNGGGNGGEGSSPGKGSGANDDES